jgi:rod shape-determining protein MreD
MRRLAVVPLAVLAAILIQLTVLNNLPFPGGTGPDLVLVLVVTLALACGPRDGMLIGFGAGLMLDAAPPATHLLGLNALVFCLVGYGSGRLQGGLERSAWLPLAGVTAGVIAGESLYALVGLTFGDPDITVASVRQVLPVSVVYDILLSPFVLYAVVRLGAIGGWAATRVGPAMLTGRELAGSGLAGARPSGVAAAASGAVRDTRGGREPHLRTAAARASDGWIGGGQRGPGQPVGAWVQRPAARLRIRGGVAGSAAGEGARQGGGAARVGRPVSLRLAAPRRRDGVVGGSLLGPARWGDSGLGAGPARGGGLRGAAFRGAAGGGSASVPGGGVPGGVLRPVAPPRLRARAFQGSAGGGTASGIGDGRPRAGTRSAGMRRLGARAFRGGPSALADAGSGRLGRPERLRLGGRRRRDGVVGGSVLGAGTSLRRGSMGGGRAIPGAAFLARRAPGAPGAPGPLRGGRGQGAVPRFREGRGLLGRRGGPLGGRRSPLSGGRGGLGARVRRGTFGRRRGRNARLLRGGGTGSRPAFWRMGSKRTGGLP